MNYPIKLACLIDDDDMYLSLLTKLIDIRKLAEEILVFKNGEEALNHFISSFKNSEGQPVPQIILLDLNMPIMDGWGFLEELSKHEMPALSNCTLYIVSSSINPVDIERSKNFNLVKDFIVKPIGPNELVEIFSETPTAP